MNTLVIILVILCAVTMASFFTVTSLVSIVNFLGFWVASWRDAPDSEGLKMLTLSHIRRGELIDCITWKLKRGEESAFAYDIVEAAVSVGQVPRRYRHIEKFGIILCGFSMFVNGNEYSLVEYVPHSKEED